MRSVAVGRTPSAALSTTGGQCPIGGQCPPYERSLLAGYLPRAADDNGLACHADAAFVFELFQHASRHFARATDDA